MSEKPSLPVQDSSLAWDAAYAEKPVRDAAIAAKQLGVLGVHGQFDARANELSDAVLQNAQSVPAEFDDTSQEQGSEALTAERLPAFFADRPIAVHGWLIGRDASKADSVMAKTGQFQNITRGKRPETAALQNTYIHQEDERANTLKYFASKGVPEVVTFLPTGEQYGKYRPNSDKSAENAVAFIYRTINEGNYSTAFLDLNHRPGNYLNIVIQLPESEAAELRQAITKNPELAHQISDSIMVDQLGYDAAEWDRIKPNYDKWKELSGGVRRVAIRDDLHATAQGVQIVEAQ